MTEKPPPPPLDPERHALLLDFDGTLVDFAPTPDAIRLRPGTIALLDRLSRRLNGALALLSGRTIKNLDAHLDPLQLPASGVHGVELRLHAGDIVATCPPATIGIARRRLAEALVEDDPLLLEDKGGALVLHYRTHPEQRERARAVADAAVLGLSDLEVVKGHAIFEIRPRSVTKAEAVGRFMDKPPFAGRVPVFVGDDVTDEDGFRGAAELGGIGVKVGRGESVAKFTLPDIGAVHRWLTTCCEGG